MPPKKSVPAEDPLKKVRMLRSARVAAAKREAGFSEEDILPLTPLYNVSLIRKITTENTFVLAMLCAYDNYITRQEEEGATVGEKRGRVRGTASANPKIHPDTYLARDRQAVTEWQRVLAKENAVLPLAGLREFVGAAGVDCISLAEWESKNPRVALVAWVASSVLDGVATDLPDEREAFESDFRDLEVWDDATPARSIFNSPEQRALEDAWRQASADDSGSESAAFLPAALDFGEDEVGSEGSTIHEDSQDSRPRCRYLDDEAGESDDSDDESPGTQASDVRSGAGESAAPGSVLIGSSFQDRFVIMAERLWTSPYLRSVLDKRDVNGHRIYTCPVVIHLLYHPSPRDAFLQKRARAARSAYRDAQDRLRGMEAALLQYRQAIIKLMEARDEAMERSSNAVWTIESMLHTEQARADDYEASLETQRALVESLKNQQHAANLEEAQLFGQWEFIRDPSLIRARDETMNLSEAKWRSTKFCERCLSEYRRPKPGEVHSCGIGPTVTLPKKGYRHVFKQWQATQRAPAFMVWDTEAMLVPAPRSSDSGKPSNTTVLNKQVVATVAYVMVGQFDLRVPSINFIEYKVNTPVADCIQQMMDDLVERAPSVYAQITKTALPTWTADERRKYMNAKQCILCKSSTPMYPRLDPPSIEQKTNVARYWVFGCGAKVHRIILREGVVEPDSGLESSDDGAGHDCDDDDDEEESAAAPKRKGRARKPKVIRQQTQLVFPNGDCWDEDRMKDEYVKAIASDCAVPQAAIDAKIKLVEKEIALEPPKIDMPGPECSNTADMNPSYEPPECPVVGDDIIPLVAMVDDDDDDDDDDASVQPVSEERWEEGDEAAMTITVWMIGIWESITKKMKTPYHVYASGDYIGAAHDSCKARVKKCEEVTCWAHNAVKYDNHQLQRAIHTRRIGTVEVPYQLKGKYLKALAEGKPITRTKDGYPIRYERNGEAWATVPAERFDAVVDNTEHLKIIRWTVFAGTRSWVDKRTGQDQHRAQWLTYVWYDSLAHFMGSVSDLAGIVGDNKPVSKHHFYNPADPRRYVILSEKNAFPYAYFDDLEKLKRPLPSWEVWNSSAALCGTSLISKAKYETVQRQYKELGCKCLGDYMEAYNKSDVTIVADVLNMYSAKVYKELGVDPLQFSSNSSFAWNAMLYGGVSFGLMHEMSHFEFMEEACRGGLSMISCRRLQRANNPLMWNYDPSKPTVWMTLLDANSLYPTAMMHKLPVECLGDDTHHMRGTPEDTEYWYNYVRDWREDPAGCSEDAETDGAWLSVDLEYPEYLHDLHRSFPLAPVKGYIDKEWLSDAQRFVASSDDVVLGGVMKLFPYLGPRRQYPVYVQTLQLYLSLGMKLVRVHRVIRFKIARVMSPWIQHNVSARQAAKDKKDKLGDESSKIKMNGVYGRSLMNERKHTNTVFREIGSSGAQKRSMQFVSHRKAVDNAAAMSCAVYPHDVRESGGHLHRMLLRVPKRKHVLKQPLFVGATILDLSKWWMYKFMYEVVLPTYIPALDAPGAIRNPTIIKTLTDEDFNRVQMHMMDTDSMLLSVRTPDLYADMIDPSKKLLSYLDCSGYKNELSLYPPRADGKPITTRKAVPGYFKDEARDKCKTNPVLSMIVGFAGVAAKLYAIETVAATLVEANIIQHKRKTDVHPDDPDPFYSNEFVRGPAWDAMYAVKKQWFDKHLPELVADDTKPLETWVGVRKAKGVSRSITSATVSNLTFKTYWQLIERTGRYLSRRYGSDAVGAQAEDELDGTEEIDLAIPEAVRVKMTQIRSKKTTLHTIQAVKKAMGASYDKQWTENGVDLYPYGHFRIANGTTVSTLE